MASRLLARLRDGDHAALSDREIDVLAAVTRGMSNQEIARSLHVSTATVMTHLLHIFQKLDVDDRTAAVTAAYKRGILRPSA